jgi:hypothetical protein
MEQGLGRKLVATELRQVQEQVLADRRVPAMELALEPVDQLHRVLVLELDKVEVLADRLQQEQELAVE